MIHSIFVYIILNSLINVFNVNIFWVNILSSFLGSFLIIWPVIYNPSKNLPKLKVNSYYWKLYSYYVLFVLLSIISAFLGYKISSILFSSYNLIDMMKEKINSVLLAILFFASYGEFSLSKVLGK